jgi:hypothetical protein
MDEYWLKTVPADITEIEFRYPPSALNETLIRSEIDKLIKDRSKYTTSLYMWLLILPTNFLIAKFSDLAVFIAH